MELSLDTDAPVDLALVVVGLLAATGAVLAFPDSPLRVVLGLPFVLFLPGYALTAALFPERHRRYEVEKGETGAETEVVEEGIGGLERVALSVGLSIAVVPLVGLALNFSPWGIRLVPILASLTGLGLVLSGAAWARRSALPAQERFRVAFRVELGSGPGATGLDALLNVALVLAVLFAVGALGYVLLNPQPGEAFTELYVLGPERRAAGYPGNLTAGENATVFVGVRNFEHRTVPYTLDAWLVGFANATGGGGNATDGNATGPNATGPIEHLYFLRRWTPRLDPLAVDVEPGRPFQPQWEEPWTFALDRSGRWRVQVALYGDGLGEDVDLPGPPLPDQDAAGTAWQTRLDRAYRSVHFWVTVQGA